MIALPLVLRQVRDLARPRRSIHQAVLLSTLALLTSAPLQAQKELGRITRTGSFGTSVAALGDLDGDSVLDLAVGAPWAWADPQGSGAVCVYSGGTRELLWRLRSTHPGQLGWSVCGLGDQDGDGVGEVAAGAPSWPTNYSGVVVVFSGRTGEALRSFQGRAFDDYFGRALTALADHEGTAARSSRSVRRTGS